MSCGFYEQCLLAGEPDEVALEHAAGCEECRAIIEIDAEIGAAAAELRTVPPPDRTILRTAMVEISGRESNRPRFRWTVAAAAVLLPFLLGFPFVLWDRPSRDQQAVEQWTLETTVIDAAERSAAEHERAVDDLAAVAEPLLEDASSPLMVSYREKLLLLDQALAEVDEAIDLNRQNSQLHQQRFALTVEKQKTLRSVIQESRNAEQN